MKLDKGFEYEFTCCICGKHITDEWGNNPFPVVNTGECCDECNYKHVIPARLKHFQQLKTKKL